MPEHEQIRGDRFGFMNMLPYLLVLLSIATFMNTQNRSPEDASISRRATEMNPTKKTPGALSSLAVPGDLLQISVSSEPPLFDAVRFADVPYSETFDRVNNKVHLNLKECLSVNCSAIVVVEWSLKGFTFNATMPLISYLPLTKRSHFLLGHSEEDQYTDYMEYRAYIQPKLTVNPIVVYGSPLPPQFAAFCPTATMDLYGPGLYLNTFWTLKDHLLEVNNTALQDFELEIEVQPLASWKAILYEQFEASMQSQQAMGLATRESGDETKRIFLETNPYFLVLTGLVTLLHMVFEYLAFANDVKFWRGRKDFKGLSLRTVAINCYFQSVIFLYLLDSSETSWSILLPTGIGVLTEYWKLLQCGSIRRVSADALEKETDGRRRWLFMGYELHFSDSYDQQTRSHDNTAIKWLMYCMIPTLFGYAIYSALYIEHRGWYSFLIHTQVQFIYFFGFAMMTPQIFINYKLKSVGQLPWRTFVYKALNTVIDDLFAFIIKMPWLHRLACFRDDVVFAVLLYQRWIYPVDTSRMEDGERCGEVSTEVEEKKQQ